MSSRRRRSAAARAGLAGALSAVFATLAARAAPADVSGTYRLEGRGRIDVAPFPAREEEIHLDAVIAPGPSADRVHLHLAAQGISCELSASLDAAGNLALSPGQRCTADFRGDEASGSLAARLLEGRGRVAGEALELALAFSLSGALRARPGSALDSLGEALSLPGAKGDLVPVHGEVRGRAEGRRDRSRATGS